jgi:DNA-binding transcriptional LysR family regulator
MLISSPVLELDLLADLEVFLSERHVTRAAARLGVTQSAASQRLARLRSELGDPLLVPGRGGLVPTPRAQAIAGPLSAALAALRSAVKEGEAFVAHESERRFVLLGNDLFEAWGMPVVVRMLEKHAPRVTVHAERAEADFAERLERGTADLAFVPNFMVLESQRRLALPDEPFVVILRKGHPAARRRLTLAKYLALDHLLIAPRGLPGSLVDAALERLGKQRRVTTRIQHFSSAPYLLAKSDLALTCPASVAQMARPYFALSVLPLPLDLPVDGTSMVWHERAHREPAHAWLRTRMAEHFARS